MKCAGRLDRLEGADKVTGTEAQRVQAVHQLAERRVRRQDDQPSPLPFLDPDAGAGNDDGLARPREGAGMGDLGGFPGADHEATHHHRHGADADVFGDDDGAGPLVDDDAGLAGRIGKGRAGKEGQRSYGDPFPRSHGTMVHHAKAKDKLRPPEGTLFLLDAQTMRVRRGDDAQVR